MQRMALGIAAAVGIALGAAVAVRSEGGPPHGPMMQGCPVGGAGMGMGLMGGGMGMMGCAGGGMMGCPMALPAEASLQVKPIDDGVTLTYTSKDPAVVKRLQKRAQIMSLMHELAQTEP
jgi:hypothetical protein